MIIDGDGHVSEPMSVWTDYLETEFYPRFHHALGPTGIETLVIEDRIQSTVMQGSPHLAGPERIRISMGDAVTPRGILPGNARNRRFDEGHPGGSQPQARLAVHDAEGIEAAVLFPTLGLFVGSARDPRVATAAARAINRWLADYCAAAPNELFGVATLAIQDPAARPRSFAAASRSVGSSPARSGQIPPWTARRWRTRRSIRSGRRRRISACPSACIAVRRRGSSRS